MFWRVFIEVCNSLPRVFRVCFKSFYLRWVAQEVALSLIVSVCNQRVFLSLKRQGSFKGVRSKFQGYLDTIPQDRSHLRGTGPSSYGTGPILFNKMGPVPNWTFSWINTIFSLIWARSHGFLLIFAPTIWLLSAVQLYKKQYKLQEAHFYSWNVNLRAIWVQSHHQLA